MITNTGKEIIAKYLMGVAPAYASYIAVGCGAKPRPQITQLTNVSGSTTTLTTTDANGTSGLWVGAAFYNVTTSGTGALNPLTVVTGITNNTTFTVSLAPTTTLASATVLIEIDKTKKVLDFEMFRVPISSRGYINDGGVNKIVFTAELPTEERYEISELGLFSAGTNNAAGAYDSKTLFSFSDSENWQFNNGSTLISPTSITSSIIDGTNVITSTADAIQTSANNTGFLNVTRAARYERPRYLNNVLMTRANSSFLKSTSGVFSLLAPSGTPSKYLQVTGQNVNFTRNSTSDLIKIAFSIVSVTGGSTLYPNSVRVMIEFSNSAGTQYARFQAEGTHALYNFSTNRYVVIEKRLDELVYSPTFSWDAMSVVKIYTSAIDNYTIITKAYAAGSPGTVTLTTSATHNLKPGDIVNIPTSMGSGYSGTFTLLTASGTTFTYAPTTTPGAGAGSLSINFEAASSQYFVALDAIRFDNVGTINPLYGMVGYSIIQNATTETITKGANSNNYIEYRVIVDVT